MSIKFLFEDNEQTPSSILLKNSYKGADIYFSNGSSLILSKVKELRKIFNDDIYIFYDLVPDNEVTVKGYTDLVRALKLNYSNVYVLPIICIEYFICISLYKFNRLKLNCTFADELIEKFIKQITYQDLSTKAKQDINNKSIEKVYKYILNKHSCKCIHNHNKNKNDIIGKYYREDCKCKSFYCKIKCRDSILTKSEILYTQLPAFVIVSEEQRDLHGELGITTQKITNIEIEQRLQSFYNNLCSNLNTNSIKVKI